MSSDHPPIYPDEYGDWAAANRGAVVRDVPRRSRMEQWAPAERAIYDALLIVEKMPADERLTDAVTLLGAAMNSVADYIDGRDRTTGIQYRLCAECASMPPFNGRDRRRRPITEAK